MPFASYHFLEPMFAGAKVGSVLCFNTFDMKDITTGKFGSLGPNAEKKSFVEELRMRKVLAKAHTVARYLFNCAGHQTPAKSTRGAEGSCLLPRRIRLCGARNRPPAGVFVKSFNPHFGFWIAIFLYHL